jgi:Uma2 family endonuclease
MGVMTETEQRTLGLPYGRPLTRADLETLPDDGHRYELIDGLLIVAPPPSIPHQFVLGELYVLLKQHCPTHLRVLFAPTAVALADDTEVQPDVLVAPRAQFTHRELVGAPLLAVEVLSPTTRRYDLLTKRSRYEEAGTASYWAIDPLELTLTAWDLVDGRFVEVAQVAGEEEYAAERPFPVTIRPSALRD